MNKNVLIIMGGAVVVAIVVAMIVQSSLAPKQVKATKQVITSGTEILIASETILKGSSIKSKNIEWKNFPDDLLFKGIVKRKGNKDVTKLEVYGKPLLHDIESGEPITKQALIMDANSNSEMLSVSLSKGMRAVAISVKAATTAGGFISPGDHVDVIFTYQVRLNGEAKKYSTEAVQRFASETILTNVRVLAVDQKVEENPKKIKVARTVTLEVNRDGVQKLVMASSMGKLSLALRRWGELDTVEDKNIETSTDVNTSKVIKQIYNLMGQSKVNSDAVRVYSGASVMNVPVNATNKH